MRHSELPSLTEFCKQRNIPWNENEQRYYMKMKHQLSNSTFKGVIKTFLRDIRTRHNLEKRDKFVPKAPSIYDAVGKVVGKLSMSQIVNVSTNFSKNRIV